LRRNRYSSRTNQNGYGRSPRSRRMCEIWKE